ncbi:hypothetical protein CCACVL1_13955 [Corchorus capsularis]|uniref:Uncharacterized protein n=1 Tax=Corchorus capsularis TaxID=210143 RepID=A0A1R3I8U7_COCAP|nr:hypothetical protein CCACVL1_13955 [Corchorus capsularis]
MEVMVPAASIMDFEFNSARSSPRSTAPSTPRRFGDCYFSAPTSPSRMSELYLEFERYSMMNDRQSSIGNSSLAIPFDWEEKPGTPKSPKSAVKDVHHEEDDDDDFAFDFSAETSLPAEELFDGGKIKPLKPPPRLQVDEHNQKSPLLSSPRSPRSPLAQGKKIIREAFSPRKKKERDPFATAIESSRNSSNTEQGRGRERVQERNSSRRVTRSLSPYRVSEYPWELEEEEQQKQRHETKTAAKQSSFSSKSSLSSNNSSKGSSSSSSSSKKWRLRDFLLFRSASEGRAADKDPLRKYSSAFFKKPEEIKNSSFRSTDSSGSNGGSRRKVSAHELHYTTNKAVSENMKKKTFLPYKQGILGRLAFNPAVHALANGFGTLTRSSS